jgi:hypothetical protein
MKGLVEKVIVHQLMKNSPPQTESIMIFMRALPLDPVIRLHTSHALLFKRMIIVRISYLS